MPMAPFVERFPELGTRETRTVRLRGWENLPDGEYAFVELYCNEPGCDCRRVIVQVLRPETGWSKVWATISYGWESPDYYRKRVGALVEPDEFEGPSLDPLNPQSQYAEALLDILRQVLDSPDYVERLKRHYQMFRASVEEETTRAGRAARK